MDGCHGGGHDDGGYMPGGEGGMSGWSLVILTGLLLSVLVVVVLWRNDWDPGAAWQCVTGGKCITGGKCGCR